MLGGFTKSLPQVRASGSGGAGCRGMGSPLGRAPCSRRLISNAPARKQLRLGISRPFLRRAILPNRQFLFR
jgi:hypothetical protein